MRIMPSGKGNMNWVPTTLVKTASSENAEVEEAQYTDELLEAAKKVVAGYECEAEEVEPCGSVMGGDDVVEDTAVDNVEFEGEVEEVSTPEEPTDVVECLEDAKEAIEKAVECVSGEETEEFETEEFETEVVLEEEGEVVLENEVVLEGGTECVSKEKPCDKVEASTEEEGEVVEASANDWVKLSAISPNNRKNIYDYWSNKLGYPKDFVKLMVKDYEK